MATRTEDEVFAEYQAAEGEARTALEAELVKLMQQHAGRVIWLTLRREDTELVSRAVTKALEAIPSFQGKSKFSTWFHTITYNECGMWLRRHKREVSLESVAEPEARDIEAELFPRLELEELIRDLDEEDKELVRAKLEGREEAELAQQFGLTREGVRSRWFQVRKHLLGSLQQSATR